MRFIGAPRRCFLESFYVAFFKKRPPIQRAERWSLVATSEIPLSFQSATEGWMPSLGSAEGNRTSGGFPLCNNAKLNFMSAFFFDTRGTKKKAWQKRNAAKGVSPLRRRPTLRALDRRRLLKKAGENFCADIAVKSPTNQNLKYPRSFYHTKKILSSNNLK